MALRLVRQTSDTPNITNKDDTVMTRYAYGGYNGIVKGFGNECGYTAENGIFKILSGRILVDGWEIDVDGAGWTLDLHSVTGNQYHSVYAEINVATESVKIDSTYQTGSYPEIIKGDDLTEIPNGTARILLYNVNVASGAITEVAKKFNIIPYLAKKVIDNEQNLLTLKNSLENGTLKPKIAQYASDDTSKGTIEERLTALGFKEGSVTLSSGTATTNRITRQGNYVIGQVSVADAVIRGGLAFTLPEHFRPKTAFSFWAGVNSTGQQQNFNDKVTATINTDGTVTFSGDITGYYVNKYDMNFGYEAPPITE